MKKGFNLSYIITKKYNDEKHCIEQIKKIQHFYKKQYEYMKHNLIKFTISKSSSDSRRSSKLSDISFYDYNYDNEDNNYNNKKDLNKIPNIGNNNASSIKNKNQNKKICLLNATIHIKFLTTKINTKKTILITLIIIYQITKK